MIKYDESIICKLENYLSLIKDNKNYKIEVLREIQSSDGRIYLESLISNQFYIYLSKDDVIYHPSFKQYPLSSSIDSYYDLDFWLTDFKYLACYLVIQENLISKEERKIFKELEDTKYLFEELLGIRIESVRKKYIPSKSKFSENENKKDRIVEFKKDKYNITVKYSLDRIFSRYGFSCSLHYSDELVGESYISNHNDRAKVNDNYIERLVLDAQSEGRIPKKKLYTNSKYHVSVEYVKERGIQDLNQLIYNFSRLNILQASKEELKDLKKLKDFIDKKKESISLKEERLKEINKLYGRINSDIKLKELAKFNIDKVRNIIEQEKLDLKKYFYHFSMLSQIYLNEELAKLEKKTLMEQILG